jgi:hypothetical protein
VDETKYMHTVSENVRVSSLRIFTRFRKDGCPAERQSS